MKSNERKMPKKVVKHFFNTTGDISRVYYTCPTCNANVTRISHCERCEQRLDWSDAK